jgi:hypothetical protein
MWPKKKQHESESKTRQETLQTELSSCGADVHALRRINAKLEAQLKIEDFRIRWRESDHAWSKLWAPTFISFVVAVAASVAGYQALAAHRLEAEGVNVEIVFRAVRDKPQETRANLEALNEAGLVHLTSQQINRLSSLTPPPAK